MMRVACALVVPGLAMVVVGSAWVGNSVLHFPLTTIDLNVGRQWFHEKCAGCHSMEPGGYGPDLGRIGALAAQRVAGMSAEEYLLESILTPDAYRQPGEDGVMPANVSSGLRREHIISLVGYLTTRGGSPNPKRLVSLLDQVEVPELKEEPTVPFAAAEAGKELYLTKGMCIHCHPLRKLPGFKMRAPSLLAAGMHDKAYLFESIVKPSKRITPGYEIWHVGLPSGTMYSGRLVRRGADSIDLLTESSGTLRVLTIPLAEIELDDDGSVMIRQGKQSAMPDYPQSVLSEAEIKLIVEFLKTLQS